jgi:hypothetical protein
MVTPILNPSEENGLLVDVVFAQLAARMCSLQLVDKTGHFRPPNKPAFSGGAGR